MPRRKNWTTGALYTRNLQATGPYKGMLELKQDILDMADRLERKVVFGDDGPFLFSVRGADVVDAGSTPKGILLGAYGGDASPVMTFVGANFQLGCGRVILSNVATEDFELFCLAGDARAYSVRVIVATGLNQPMAVSYVSGLFTITLGTDGAGAPDNAKNTLALIVAAMLANTDIQDVFAFGLTTGQPAMVLDQAVTTTLFTEPTLLYGKTTLCALCGQPVFISNILPGAIEVTVPKATLEAAGTIGAVADSGDMMRGVLTVDGYAFEYFMLAGTK